MDNTQAPWRLRLGSALRTVLACSIVGCTTLYGPESVRHTITFPAFSYVTTILIVSDATLGDALRGCWHVLCASIQVILPSMLILRLIGPSRFNCGLAAVAVALSSFLIALPGSTHLTAKRIAFGQTVIIYVGAVIQGAKTGIIIHPIHVAASTALGAVASILAMMFPYPHLAYREVRKICRFYAENASNRFNLLVEAFCAKGDMAAHNLITDARLLSKAGAKLIGSIKDKHEGMLWEKPWLRFLKPKRSDPGEKLKEMDMPIRGMEWALTNCTSFPVKMMDEELVDVLQIEKKQIALKLEQAMRSVPFDAATTPDMKGENTDRSLWTQKAISTNHEDLSSFFFLYCMELLQDGPACILKNGEEAKIQESSQPKKQGKSRVKQMQSFRRENLLFAIKCSLSLGLAVLFGLIYNKENGYWSGLTIAISFVTERQATFMVANARAQGTAMGSVYGILCCFIFKKLTDLRFLLLLPWIIFTSFLRHSRMYGQAGGIAAVIGASLILGRKNYGTPSEFAIARTAEATIGLICFVAVEILFHPSRSATLAKTELSRTLRALQDCFKVISLHTDRKENLRELMREKQKKLRYHVRELQNFIAEAELEPNFWFLPFHCGCYNKLLMSICKMTDLLHFTIHLIGFLSAASQMLGVTWEEIQEQIKNVLEHLVDKTGSLSKCLDKVLLVKFLEEIEKQLQMESVSRDLELGKSPNADVSTRLGYEETSISEIGKSFLQYTIRVADKAERNEVEEMLKSQMVLCLSSLGYCLNDLKREATETEKEIAELLKWENPTRHVNFPELLSKLHAT
ncbi:FUSC_2 domain-containing protein [Gossypium australe]|uniref:FUSC_2 domain-containing protein n=1 Tax=Gossypium australe TaxID=47621 RepID=A0A5B6V769_9ROSI|nr:FUSC_2 domain-containing protein [Gossypium australe]